MTSPEKHTQGDNHRNHLNHSKVPAGRTPPGAISGFLKYKTFPLEYPDITPAITPLYQRQFIGIQLNYIIGNIVSPLCGTPSPTTTSSSKPVEADSSRIAMGVPT